MTFIENNVQIFLCKKRKSQLQITVFTFYMMERHADLKSKHDRYMIAYESWHNHVDPKSKHNHGRAFMQVYISCPLDFSNIGNT